MMRFATIAVLTALPGVVSAAEDSSSGGLPQLDSSTYASQVFWLAISFIIIYLFMSRYALPRISDVLEEREEQRQSDLERATHLKNETAEVQASYEKAIAQARIKAREVIGETEGEMREAAAQRNAQFAEKAKKRFAEAEAKINKAKEEALLDISLNAAEIVANAASRIGSLPANDTDAQKMVKAVMQGGK